MTELIVAGQDEAAANTLRQKKRLEQGSRKLDGLAVVGPNHHLFENAAIIIQILFGSDLKIKFVAIHGPAHTFLEESAGLPRTLSLS